MKAFLIILVMVCIQNTVKAEEITSAVQETLEGRLNPKCVEEQRELIEENRDGYSKEQIKKQYADINVYCLAK